MLLMGDVELLLIKCYLRSTLLNVTVIIPPCSTSLLAEGFLIVTTNSFWLWEWMGVTIETMRVRNELWFSSLSQVQTTTMCISVSLSGFVVLGCMFAPKVHIIMFQPQKNVTSHRLNMNRFSVSGPATSYASHGEIYTQTNWYIKTFTHWRCNMKLLALQWLIDKTAWVLRKNTVVWYKHFL